MNKTQHTGLVTVVVVSAGKDRPAPPQLPGDDATRLQEYGYL